MESAGLEKLTPMMRQYYELKEKAAEAILFFRMGDFYEIFGDDALAVAPKLELVITSRERGDNERIPFCGVPHHSARNYWLRLLKMGYRVALADQMEDPAEAKGLVRRDITRILTPGCVDELEALEADKPNYLLSVWEQPEKRIWALALCDVSTGELRCGNVAKEELFSTIRRYAPREILCRQFVRAEFASQLEAGYEDSNGLLFGSLKEDLLRDSKQQQALFESVLGKKGLKDQPCGAVVGGEVVLASLFSYLQELHQSCDGFNSVRALVEPSMMTLDETVIRDLELFETVRRRGVQGSLYYEINRSLTPMGARLLRQFLLNPLLRKEEIALRLEAVSLFHASKSLLAGTRQILDGMADLERLLARTISGFVHPQELARMREALNKAQRLAELFSKEKISKDSLLAPALLHLKKANEPLLIFEKALVEETGALGHGNQVFKAGFDKALDQLMDLSEGGAQKVAAYETALREKTGIGSLKIKNHKTYGLLIEITKTHLSKTPAEFTRRQTMVNCERFSTPDLQKLSDALIKAQVEAVQREAVLFSSLIEAIREHRESIRQLSAAIGQIDVFQGFATKALEASYCRPSFSSQGDISLIASRHPVVETYVSRHKFVPNDVLLDSKEKQVLITGPNMAGKSTVMRQTALCAILHQIGSFIPAREARMPIFDQIFTRVGAADDLAKGQSTFMVEMSEAATILRQATSQSLVILDEVGRGTSTSDGLAIASAILEDLVCRIQCFCLFATHYHEMIPIAAGLEGVRMAQTEVIEDKDGIRFTHRLVNGASGSSFGIEVARLAGIPTNVLKKAKNYLRRYQEVEELPSNGSIPPIEQFGFFKEEVRTFDGEAPIQEKLQELNLSETTPLQALNILSDLKSLYEQNAH